MIATKEVAIDPKKRNCCRNACLCLTISMLFLSLLILILALTVFKPQKPKIELLSASVEGVSPRLSFPALNLELNLTLNLKLLIKNPNHVGFKHGPSQSYLLYKGKQMGEADIPPGNMPAAGSEIMNCKLILELDPSVSGAEDLINDVMAGQLTMDTYSKIAGRVNFFGIKKHITAISECQFVIALQTMNIQSQECKNKAKF